MAADLVKPDDRGLACGAGGFWIDPWRPVDLAVVTHAHADHARPGCARYLAAAPGVPLLRRRLGPDAVVEGVPFGEPVRSGNVTLSFHPAGHVLGSAQVRIDDGHSAWVVSGDFKREADPTCDAYQPVRCDVLVTEATFALPIYRWRSGGEVVGEIRDWWQRARESGRCAVLFCYALGKAQRVLAELHALGIEEEVALHGAIAPLVDIYRDASIAMPPTTAVADAPDGVRWRGRLVLAPPSAAGSPWLRRFQPYTTAFASGWMRVRGNRRRRGVDRGFVLSDHADWPGLLQSVTESGARDVRCTHGYADVLARYLRDQGLEASVLETAPPVEGDD